MTKAGKRSREDVEAYDSDAGFVSLDDAPKKKSKKVETSSIVQAGQLDEEFWELSSGRNSRRVAISSFKNVHLVNIREYYEKSGEYLPGKKGISLTVEQYQAFLRVIPEINSALQRMGVKIGDQLDESEDGPKTKAGFKKQSSLKEPKSNIDTTSDEDE